MVIYSIIGVLLRCMKKDKCASMLKRTKPYVYACSFCLKNHQQITRLIAGPNRIYICNECVMHFVDSEVLPEHNQQLVCSFCGKQQQQIANIWSGEHGVNICSECLELCVDIIAASSSHNA